MTALPVSTLHPVSPLREYIDGLNDLPTDVLLGRIVIFTITDNPVRLADVETAFDTLGLNKAYLPAPNKSIDAFRRATSETKDTYPLSKGRTAQLMCRDVTSTTDVVIRQITREIKDGGRRRLAYDGVIRITYNRIQDPNRIAPINVSLDTSLLGPDEIEHVRAAALAIKARYDHMVEFLDDQKVRGTVRNYLKFLNAMEIKGGMYFVPVSRDEELKKLSQFVDGLGGGCHMNAIPLVDLGDQRQFITDIFEREAAQALSDIVKEADTMIATSKTITPSAYARMKGRLDQVMTNAEEHVMNLQVTQDLTAGSAELAMRALRRLQEAMLNG